jgi:hypothetical protein
MTRKIVIPEHLKSVRLAALRAVVPVRAADENTQADKKLLFTAQRTTAGDKLPSYHLVYFLLVDLLGFKDLGQWEKVAWSVPIDFNGKAFLIEHRKFGVGVFAHDAAAEEAAAREIVIRIQKGVKAAEPFFAWLAERAVQESRLNVVNCSRSLFARYGYFLEQYRAKAAKAKARADERIVETREIPSGTVTQITIPAWELTQHAH